MTTITPGYTKNLTDPSTWSRRCTSARSSTAAGRACRGAAAVRHRSTRAGGRDCHRCPERPSGAAAGRGDEERPGLPGRRHQPRRPQEGTRAHRQGTGGRQTSDRLSGCALPRRRARHPPGTRFGLEPRPDLPRREPNIRRTINQEFCDGSTSSTITVLKPSPTPSQPSTTRRGSTAGRANRCRSRSSRPAVGPREARTPGCIRHPGV